MDLPMQEIAEITQRLERPKKNPVDDVINNKIQYGPAQMTILLSINILLFTEGCQSAVISLILPELQKQWDISVAQQSLLLTLIYFGITIGSFFQSYADDMGRFVFLKWNAVIHTLCGLLSCFAPTISWFIFARFVYGIGIGIILPISAMYIYQVTPALNRAGLITKSRVYWAIGSLCTLISAWFLLARHQWRILMFIMCLPGVYALWDIYTSGRQTLRYLWVKGRNQQVHEMVSYMCKLNNRPEVSKKELDYLMTFKQQKAIETEYKQLFNAKYRKMTILLSISWFSSCFVYFGILSLLPSILSKNKSASYNQRYFDMIILGIFQLLTFLSIRRIIVHPKMGRKRTLYMGGFLTAIFSGLLMLFGENNQFMVFICFLGLRISASTNQVAIFPFTIQIYHTLIRGKGLGFCSVIGRVGSVLLGMIGLSSLSWFGGNGLYALFSMLGFMSGIAIFNMPFCTLGRPLDT